MIDDLTPEQEEQMKVYAKKWKAIADCTEPANRELAEEAIQLAYKNAELPEPEIIWTGSPMGNLKAKAEYEAAKTGKTVDECMNIEEGIENSFYAQYDKDLACYEFMREVLGLVEETEPILGLLQLAKNASCALPYYKVCFISERPTELHYDEKGRLHNDDGPSILYPDGFCTHHTHGVRLTKEKSNDN